MQSTINPQEAFDLLKSGMAILVDVRSPMEYSSSRIGGSMLIPVNTFQNHWNLVKNYFPANKKVIFYCASGIRSGSVTDYVNENTEIEAYNLVGGIVNWGREGLEVER